jgi:hypothetical protein
MTIHECGGLLRLSLSLCSYSLHKVVRNLREITLVGATSRETGIEAIAGDSAGSRGHGNSLTDKTSKNVAGQCWK